jgi:hypothetical protein
MNNVFAVNCEIDDKTLQCGGLYLLPQVQTQLIRLAHDGVSVDVELPSELLSKPEASRAWAVNLPIRHEQIRQHSVRG